VSFVVIRALRGPNEAPKKHSLRVIKAGGGGSDGWNLDKGSYKSQFPNQNYISLTAGAIA